MKTPRKEESSAKKAASQAFSFATSAASNALKVGGEVAQVATEIGGKAAKNVSEGFRKAAGRARQNRDEKKLARLNPLFPDQYNDSNFDLPNMVVIADEDQRKGIPECEGAIGWIDKDTELEVLNLYLEAVPFSGLSFYPPASIGDVYYRDTFNDRHFIALKDFSSVVLKDKMTELQDIAFALGAEECRLESFESTQTSRTEKSKVAAKVKTPIPGTGATASANFAEDETTSEKRLVRFEQRFEGARDPVQPELKWFEHDKEINSLIKKVLSGHAPKEYTIRLDSSASCSLSSQLASKIDSSLKKLKVSMEGSMKKRASAEAQQTLDYYIKFKD